MPGQLVISAATLDAGIRSEFSKTYAQTYEASAARLASCMDLNIGSDTLVSTYAYYTSAPAAKIWRRGEAIQEDAFDSVSWSVENLRFGSRVSWMEMDREDDQTKSLLDRARDAGRSFGELNERVFFQLLLSAADPDLLQAIPLAPDGAALYATTAGGAARFGITNGNLLTGTGVASSAAVRTDFFSAIEQMRGFQGTNGQPLWNSFDDFTVVYGVHNEEVFREAFVQARTLDGGAAVSNVLLSSGLRINLWSTQRIPSGNDDWYVFAGVPGGRKSLFEQRRKGLTEEWFGKDNSDMSRSLGVEGVQWSQRSGYGVALPTTTVQLNN
jgi:hypothetical protein